MFNGIPTSRCHQKKARNGKSPHDPRPLDEVPGGYPFCLPIGGVLGTPSGPPVMMNKKMGKNVQKCDDVWLDNADSSIIGIKPQYQQVRWDGYNQLNGVYIHP
jgi:hypothetical protein